MQPRKTSGRTNFIREVSYGKARDSKQERGSSDWRMFPGKMKQAMGRRIGTSNPPKNIKKEKKADEPEVFCPSCGAPIIITEPRYYIDHGDGELSKDSEYEWECPNGCLFDDETISRIDTMVENLALIGRLPLGNNKTSGG